MCPIHLSNAEDGSHVVSSASLGYLKIYSFCKLPFKLNRHKVANLQRKSAVEVGREWQNISSDLINLSAVCGTASVESRVKGA